MLGHPDESAARHALTRWGGAGGGSGHGRAQARRRPRHFGGRNFSRGPGPQTLSAKLFGLASGLKS